jgi:NADP-dependent 3-hydroxy acid dehydrogenase YdfG
VVPNMQSKQIPKGLRQEEAISGTNIHVTNVSPGAVSSELLETTTDPETKAGLDEFYKVAIDADSIARTMVFAIEQPSDVAINEWKKRYAPWTTCNGKERFSIRR